MRGCTLEIGVFLDPLFSTFFFVLLKKILDESLEPEDIRTSRVQYWLFTAMAVQLLFPLDYLCRCYWYCSF